MNNISDQYKSTQKYTTYSNLTVFQIKDKSSISANRKQGPKALQSGISTKQLWIYHAYSQRNLHKQFKIVFHVPGSIRCQSEICRTYFLFLFCVFFVLSNVGDKSCVQCSRVEGWMNNRREPTKDSYRSIHHEPRILILLRRSNQHQIYHFIALNVHCAKTNLLVKQPLTRF